MLQPQNAGVGQGPALSRYRLSLRLFQAVWTWPVPQEQKHQQTRVSVLRQLLRRQVSEQKRHCRLLAAELRWTMFFVRQNEQKVESVEGGTGHWRGGLLVGGRRGQPAQRLQFELTQSTRQSLCQAPRLFHYLGQSVQGQSRRRCLESGHH